MQRVPVGMSVLLGVSILGGPVASAGSWAERAREVAEQRLSAARQQRANEQAWAHGVTALDLRLDASVLQTGAPRERSEPGFIEHGITLHAADVGAEPVPDTQPACTESCPTIERGPLPTLGETLVRDLKEMPGLLWHDTKKVYLNPWNIVFLVGAGGASVALRPEADDDLEDWFGRDRVFNKCWSDTFATAGNPITHFALAGAWYLLGQQFQDIKTYEVGKRMVSALTITGVSTVLLKLAACTESPNGEDFGWPSGHVSSTMAFATVLNRAYGPLVGVPMYALTGLVAVQRMDAQEHHFSDVVFGAALGWVVAETVMKEHRPEIFGGEIAPYVDPVSGNSGVAWLKTLGN